MAEKSTQTGSDIPLLITTLKALFRAQGLRYADIATALDISLMTVKRYLSGKGLTLAVLEKLCQQAGVSLIELSEMAARQSQQEEAALTPEQEAALAEHHTLALLLHLLMDGWTAEEIQKEFHLSPPVLIGTLSYLDRLGFIDLMPGNRVRIRMGAARSIKWSRSPLLQRSFSRHLKQHFTRDFDDPELHWRYAQVKLSAASIKRLDTLFDELTRTIYELGRQDRTQGHAETQWHGALLVSQPIDLSELQAPSFLKEKTGK